MLKFSNCSDWLPQNGCFDQLQQARPRHNINSISEKQGDFDGGEISAMQAFPLKFIGISFKKHMLDWAA